MLERITICVCLQVKRIVIHPKYDPATTNNDVALLKLKDKIDFSKFDGTVAPICIPQQLRAYTGQTVRAESIQHSSSFGIKSLFVRSLWLDGEHLERVNNNQRKYAKSFYFSGI